MAFRAPGDTGLPRRRPCEAGGDIPARLGALWVLGEEGAGEGEALVVGLPRAREVTGLHRGVADPVEADGDIPARFGALWVLGKEGAA
ncbi:MAG: hypothetical protein IPO67_27255 [Deltaproteobacteria bacterium]|nr:hypothetical protein [Deltaproteobacteria bacterium]